MDLLHSKLPAPNYLTSYFSSPDQRLNVVAVTIFEYAETPAAL